MERGGNWDGVGDGILRGVDHEQSFALVCGKHVSGCSCHRAALPVVECSRRVCHRLVAIASGKWVFGAFDAAGNFSLLKIENPNAVARRDVAFLCINAHKSAPVALCAGGVDQFNLLDYFHCGRIGNSDASAGYVCPRILGLFGDKVEPALKNGSELVGGTKFHPLVFVLDHTVCPIVAVGIIGV